MLAVSVIIPTYRDDIELAGLLRSLRHLSIDEIIIVDGEVRPVPAQFNDNPNQNIIWHSAQRGRGAQIAAGIKIVAKPYVWVLHADCRPGPRSVSEIWRLLANPNTTMASFPLAFRTHGITLSLFALLSRIDSPVTTFGDQGFAFRKTDYERLNLNLHDYPLLEDVALRSALRRIGRVKKARVKIPTSARRFETLGVWQTQLRNFGILLNYWRGASPKTLHSQYYQSTRQTVPASPPS